MKRKIMILLLVLLVTGCSVVRIDTENIDNILNVILTKDNKLYNQIGQGYKYYLPGGVSYIESDDRNDILYCNGIYYYLYVDAVSYYHKVKFDYEENKDAYYFKSLSKEFGFKHDGYIEIIEKNNLFYLKFMYNYAKIEAIIKKENINETVLNASYILSTIKYNHDIVELMLNDDYFTNKTGKYNDYNTKEDSGKFVLEKESTDNKIE